MSALQSLAGKCREYHGEFLGLRVQICSLDIARHCERIHGEPHLRRPCKQCLDSTRLLLGLLKPPGKHFSERLHGIDEHAELQHHCMPRSLRCRCRLHRFQLLHRTRPFRQPRYWMSQSCLDGCIQMHSVGSPDLKHHCHKRWSVARSRGLQRTGLPHCNHCLQR